MGIKGAKRWMGVSVLSLLLTAPVCAQDADEVDTTRSSADSSSDTASDVDRTTLDRTRASERDDLDIDVPAILRDERKSIPKAKLGVLTRLLDLDSELDVDNDERDRGDNIDRDGVDDGDKPKNSDKKKQDVVKKDAKKEAPKKDDAAGPKKDAAAGPKKPGDCVDVKGEARFSGVGYDHLVTLKSNCKKRVQCAVRTNVNPEPANVTLDPGEVESVLTWRGSPAREFTPDVKCD